MASTSRGLPGFLRRSIRSEDSEDDDEEDEDEDDEQQDNESLSSTASAGSSRKKQDGAVSSSGSAAHNEEDATAALSSSGAASTAKAQSSSPQHEPEGQKPRSSPAIMEPHSNHNDNGRQQQQQPTSSRSVGRAPMPPLQPNLPQSVPLNRKNSEPKLHQDNSNSSQSYRSKSTFSSGFPSTSSRRLVEEQDPQPPKPVVDSKQPLDRPKTYRETQFEKVFAANVVSMNDLKTLAWNGIPSHYRPQSWKILLGYLPTNASRRQQTLTKKRSEYRDAIAQHYNIDDNSRTLQEQEVLRQVLVDVPRTAPTVQLFRDERIKRFLTRILFCWAMRHPASSYVQGINDLVTPLIVTFLADYSNHRHDDNHNDEDPTMTNTNNNNTDNTGESTTAATTTTSSSVATAAANNSDGTAQLGNSAKNSIPELHHNKDVDYDEVLDGRIMESISDERLHEIEADCYWCLTNLLAGIQDHYTSDQPGVQRMVLRLEELVNRIDADLCCHLRDTGIEFMQFAFKWMNCLLLREFNLKCVIRLWDTYISEKDGFEDFHVYVCAAFLCQFSQQLQAMTFDELFGFMQAMPTGEWGDTEIEMLLSQAYVLSTLFGGSDAHLTAHTNRR